MTTTRHIIDVTADLVPGFEAEETSEAKNIAYEILEYDHIPDSGDAITAADRVVEALIKAGWRPTVEQPADEASAWLDGQLVAFDGESTATEHVEGEQADPTDAEVEAAARAIDPEAWETDLSEERGADRYMIRGRRGQAVTLARAALVAARTAARHE